MQLKPFENVYEYTELYELVQSYKANQISWKYTSVLVDGGSKEYVCSAVDGEGNEIKIYKRNDVVFKSVGQLAKEQKLTEKEVYYKYYKEIHTTAMPQSSIRVRVMEALKDSSISKDCVSIEYVPRSGRNKGVVYEQFYRGEKFRLVTWLSDVVEVRGDEIFKKDKQGTYWDGINLNNLTKEGNVEFANGKKPESLIEKIISMSSDVDDYVLDSFLGSGTTAAVAHKLKRKWIGIELGEHANTHCSTRLKSVINGDDQGGISKALDWKGGGGFKFYNLAPSLLKQDTYGNWVIDEKYNATMLAHAMCKHEGFRFEPHAELYWKQGKSTETDFIFVTTNFVTVEQLDTIHGEMLPGESLLICAKSFAPECEGKYPTITTKKIPKMILGKCEFGKENYDLNIIERTEEVEEEQSDNE